MKSQCAGAVAKASQPNVATCDDVAQAHHTNAIAQKYSRLSLEIRNPKRMSTRLTARSSVSVRHWLHDIFFPSFRSVSSNLMPVVTATVPNRYAVHAQGWRSSPMMPKESCQLPLPEGTVPYKAESALASTIHPSVPRQKRASASPEKRHAAHASYAVAHRKTLHRLRNACTTPP
jgi:hypothetical protein